MTNAGSINIRFRSDLSDALTGFRQFGTNFGSLVQQTQGRINSLSASINTFQSVVGTGLGVAILKLGSDFDTAITNVRAITKETADEFDATRQRVLQISSDFEVAGKTAAAALFDITSASITGEAAFRTLEAGILASRAGLVDAAVATNVLVGTLNAFGISGNNADIVAGKLIRTVDLGILTFEDLAASLGQVAPLAAGVGIELEELLATLATLTRQGVRFRQAVTNVRGIIVGVTAATGAYKTALEDVLGVQTEAAIETLGFQQVLQKLIDSTEDGINFTDLFGSVEAISGLTAIAGSGIEGLIADIEKLQQAGGDSLRETAEIQGRSFAVAAAGLRNVIQNEAILFFERYRDVIVDGIRATTEFIKNNRELVTAFVATAAALAALSASLLLVKGSLTVASLALGVFSSGTVGLAGKVVTAAKNINILIPLMAAETATRKTLTAAMAAQAFTLQTVAKGYSAAAFAQNQAFLSGFITEKELLTELGKLRGTVATQSIAQSIAQIRAARGATVAIGTQATAFQRLLPTVAALGPAFRNAGAGLRNLVGLFASGATRGAAFAGVLASVSGGLKALGVAAAAAVGPIVLLAAKLAAMAATAVVFFRVGREIRNFVEVGGREAQQQARAIIESAKIEKELADIRAVRLRSERQAISQQQTEAIKAETDALLRLEAANKRAAEGDKDAADQIATLRQEYDRLAESQQGATEAVTNRIEAIRNQIDGAFRQVEQLGKTASSAEGALVQGLGLDSQEASDLVAELQRLVAQVRDYDEAAARAAESARIFEQIQKSLAGVTNSVTARVGELAIEVDKLNRSAREAGQSPLAAQVLDLAENFDTAIEQGKALNAELQRLDEAIARAGSDSPAAESAAQTRADILDQLDTVEDTLGRFRTLFSEAVNEESKSILDSRLRVQDEIERAAIASLRNEGREREASEREAALRAQQERRAINESLAEEEQRRRGLLELAEQLRETGDTDAANRIENLARESELSTRTLQERLAWINRTYEEELVRINENAEQAAQRQQEEADRQARIDLERERRALQLRAIEAIRTGNLDQELRIRTDILSIERQLQASSEQAISRELQLVGLARDRVDALREQFRTLARINASADEFASAASRAQSDIIGASSAVDIRAAARSRFQEVGGGAGIETIRRAVETALRAEAAAQSQRRRDAVGREDQAGIAEATRALDEIREKYRIIVEEARAAIAELARIEQQKIEAEKAIRQQAIQDLVGEGATAFDQRAIDAQTAAARRRGAIGDDQQIIGRDAVGNPVVVAVDRLREAIEAATRPGEGPGAGTQQGGTGGLVQQVDQASDQASESETAATGASEAVETMADRVRSASQSIVGAVNNLRDSSLAIVDSIDTMASSVVTVLGDIVRAQTATITRLNENTAYIEEQRAQLLASRISGRR